jgi:hypothetical protein
VLGQIERSVLCHIEIQESYQYMVINPVQLTLTMYDLQVGAAQIKKSTSSLVMPVGNEAMLRTIMVTRVVDRTPV